jgi:hypothetical protein
MCGTIWRVISGEERLLLLLLLFSSKDNPLVKDRVRAGGEDQLAGKSGALVMQCVNMMEGNLMHEMIMVVVMRNE